MLRRIISIETQFTVPIHERHHQMSQATLHYPDTTTPERLELRAVAPGIRWLRMALPWSLNHINLWLIDDGEGVAIVDTGLGNEDCRAQWDAVLAELDKPVSKIIVTHFHPDHLGNADWLAQRLGVSIWMSTGEYLLAHALYNQTSGYDVPSMLAHFQRHGLDAARLDALAERGNVFRRGVPTLPYTYRRLIHDDILRVGQHDWRAIAGYGHSHEHIALYCHDLRVLISGDMLLPRITTNISVPATLPEEDSIGRFLGSLRHFDVLPAETLVLPAHGLPFQGIQGRVTQLFQHHEDRDQLLLETLAEPRSAAEVLSTLFPRELDNHQLMFALGEAIAHLNHQWVKGATRRIELADGVIRYQRQ